MLWPLCSESYYWDFAQQANIAGVVDFHFICYEYLLSDCLLRILLSILAFKEKGGAALTLITFWPKVKVWWQNIFRRNGADVTRQFVTPRKVSTGCILL